MSLYQYVCCILSSWVHYFVKQQKNSIFVTLLNTIANKIINRTKQKFFTMHKQLLSIILIFTLFFIPFTMRAETVNELATRINSFTGEGAGSLFATINEDTVIVTGTLKDVTVPLVLDIDEDITVEWKADIATGDSFTGSALLLLSGSGTLNISEGSIAVENEKVTAIFESGPSSTIMVSGGMVRANTSNTIIVQGERSQVLVSGGVVNGKSVVIAIDNGNNIGLNVIVSGTGKVESTGDTSTAIITGGDVEVSDDAQIIAKGHAIFNQGIGSTITVKGGVINSINSSAISFPTISTVIINGGIVSSSGFLVVESRGTNDGPDVNVIVGGTGKVKATGNGLAINTNGSVIVTDNAEVSSTIACAISASQTWWPVTITVNGGLVFSYGNAITGMDNVIYLFPPAGFTGATDTGVIIAWNQAAGNTIYTSGSSDDITLSPAYATAYWDIIGTNCGISYANGTNTGFIPLDVTVFSPSGIDNISQVQSLKAWIKNGQLHMSGLTPGKLWKCYNIFGAIVHQSIADNDEAEITLPAHGMYIVQSDNSTMKVIY